MYIETHKLKDYKVSKETDTYFPVIQVHVHWALADLGEGSKPYFHTKLKQ